MGLAGCWSAGAGAINNNRLLCVRPPFNTTAAACWCWPSSLFLSLTPAYSTDQLYSRGPKEARLSFTTATVSTAVAHTVATVPPGPLELASARASFDGSPPVWDDGRTGASTGGLEVACCGPAAGWGRRFWARDQGDQRWGVLVRDASGREALSGPLALGVPAPDGPSFRARRGRRDR